MTVQWIYSLGGVVDKGPLYMYVYEMFKGGNSH